MFGITKEFSQVGWGSKQPGLVEGAPVCGREAGITWAKSGIQWSLRSLPTHVLPVGSPHLEGFFHSLLHAENISELTREEPPFSPMKSLLETVTASESELLNLKKEQRSCLQDTCWEEIKPDNSAMEPSPGEEDIQN